MSKHCIMFTEISATILAVASVVLVGKDRKGTFKNAGFLHGRNDHVLDSQIHLNHHGFWT